MNAAAVAWHQARPLWFIWNGMRQRCLSAKSKMFHRYGGRGIRIHAPWANSYATFQADIESAIGPRVGLLTLDRINNDGNYEPGNLRWATRAEQSANKVQARGETQGGARLTDASVYAIRRLVALDLFEKQQIAGWFGVACSTLSHIIHGRTWRHVR